MGAVLDGSPFSSASVLESVQVRRDGNAFESRVFDRHAIFFTVPTHRPSRRSLPGYLPAPGDHVRWRLRPGARARPGQDSFNRLHRDLPGQLVAISTSFCRASELSSRSIPAMGGGANVYFDPDEEVYAGGY